MSTVEWFRSLGTYLEPKSALYWLCVQTILARSALHLPGHTASIGNAHPHLVIAKDVPWPGLGRIGCGSGQALGRVALRDRD